MSCSRGLIVCVQQQADLPHRALPLSRLQHQRYPQVGSVGRGIYRAFRSTASPCRFFFSNLGRLGRWKGKNIQKLFLFYEKNKLKIGGGIISKTLPLLSFLVYIYYSNWYKFFTPYGFVNVLYISYKNSKEFKRINQLIG